MSDEALASVYFRHIDYKSYEVSFLTDNFG
jgi:hypothetical protein